MQKLSPFLLVAALMVASTVPVARGATDIGRIVVPVEGRINVRVSANSPELQRLAEIAFDSHGLYKRVAGGAAYDLKFTSAGGNQVRVDIVRGSGGAPVFSQTVSGTSARNALLRAADVAVEKTNAQRPALRGFFASRLAFISQRTGKSEVYLSDLFGGEVVQLSHDRALALAPRWSPDGSRVIYTSYFKTGAPDIFVHQVTGARDTYLSVRGTNTGARFSPNGGQVAMVLTGEGASQIYVRSAGGGRPTPITRSDAVKSSPCWSPDGSQIMFAMDPGPQLYVVSASGGAPQRVSSNYSYMAEPDWSHTDRNKVVCTVRVAGGLFRIAVVDLATRQAKLIEAKGITYDAVEPSWLPDGRHVLCTMRDRRNSVLAVLDTETGNSYPVSTVNPAMQASVWAR